MLNQVQLRDYAFILSKVINLVLLLSVIQYVNHHNNYLKKLLIKHRKYFLLSIMIVFILQISEIYSFFSFTRIVNRNEIILFMFPFLFYLFPIKHDTKLNFKDFNIIIILAYLFGILMSRTTQILALLGLLGGRRTVVFVTIAACGSYILGNSNWSFLTGNRFATIPESLSLLVKILQTNSVIEGPKQEADRLILILGAIRIFVDNLWWGIGQGLQNYREVLSEYLNFYRMTRPHNLYISSLATRGLIGTSILFLFLILIYKKAKSVGNGWSVILILVYWVFNEYYEHPIIWVIFGMCISLRMRDNYNS